MSNINEVAKSTVLLDGKQADQELKKLSDRADKLNKELNELRKANDKSGFDKKRKELQQVKKEMRALENQTRDVTLILKKLNGASLDDLYFAKRKLRAQMKGLKRDTQEYIEKSKQYKLVTKEIQKATGAVNRHGSMWSRAANTFNKYLGIVAAGAATVMGFVFSIRNWIQGNVGLSDSLADVMKTTGLTRKEVRELYTEFRYLNTRTPRKELLALAEEAGRLGKKSKKDVMDFVEVANQIKVALGDDLGGNAEVAIREVGKITEIFRVGRKYNVDFRQSMLMVGSAINEVSANSQAQAPYLIEYMKRLSGVASQAGISSDQVIGYAAVLDEKGQTVEMSATAMGKVVVNMFKDTGEYAKIAGMGVGEFTNLLNKDANEAFIKVLEGLNGNNAGLSVMASKLEELGLDGSRAVQVLASLASSTDRIRDRQALANKSLVEATSLTNEYNVKNQNLAGNVERIGRAIRAWFINSSFIGWLEKAAGWMSKWVEIPVEEKLRKEQYQAKILIRSIVSLNEGNKHRSKLLNELKQNYPDLLKNIDSERVSNQQLLNILNQINEQYEERITLAAYNEDLQRIETEGKDIFLQQEDLIKKINTQYEEYIANKMEDASLEEKIRALREDELDQAMLMAKWRELADPQSGVTTSDIEASIRSNVIKNTDEYNQLLERQTQLEKEYQEVFSKRLEFTKGKDGQDSSTESGPDTPPDTPTTLAPTEEDIASIQERYNRVEQIINESVLKQKEILRKNFEEEKLTEMEFNRELEILEIAHLEAMIEARREAGMQTIDLENQVLNKKIAIIEAEQRAKEKAEKADNKRFDTEQKMRERQVQMAVHSGMAAVQNAETMEEAAAAVINSIREEIRAWLAKAVAIEITKLLVSVPAPFNLALAAGAGAIVGGLFDRIIPQFYKGKYPVTGADDGKTYQAGFASSPGTGLLSTPTILAGELPEIIIDPATTRNLQMNYPGVIQAINAARVPQYAGGSYSATREIIHQEKTFSDPAMVSAMMKFSQAVDKLQEKGIPSYTLLDGEFMERFNQLESKFDEMQSDVNM